MTEFFITNNQLKGIDHGMMPETVIDIERYTRLILLHLEDWRPFFRKPLEVQAKWENELKNGLDDLSQSVIDRLLAFYRMLMLAEKTMGKRIGRYDFLLNKDFFLFDEEVKTEEKVLAETVEIVKSVRFPQEIEFMIDPYQFGAEYGLKFVPKNKIDLREKDVIDGGGYCGDSALVFRIRSPRMIYTFEPNPTTFDLLKRVLQENQAENDVRPIAMALGTESGTFPFYTNDGVDYCAGLQFQHAKNRIDVPCTTIDHFVQENDLRPGLIKLDIEGGEYEVLIGASETIRRFQPILLISVYHRASDFFEIKPFLERLYPAYRFVFRQMSFKWLNTETCLIAYPDGD